MLRASIAETWQPQTSHESGVLRKKITHILFSFVFLPIKQNFKTADDIDRPPFVFLLKFDPRVSMRYHLTVKMLIQWTGVRSRGPGRIF